MYTVKFLDSSTTIKQGDTIQEFQAQIISRDGTPTDLTGSTVNLRLASIKGLRLDKPCTVDDATSGIVSFSFNENDVTGYGRLEGELYVKYSTGGEFSAPTNNYLRFNIERNLADLENESVTTSLYTQIIDAQSGQDVKITENKNLLSKFDFNTTPQNGDVFSYDLNMNKWKPKPPTGGGSNPLNNTLYVDDFDGVDDNEKIQNAINFASVMENGMSHVMCQDRTYSINRGTILKQNVLMSFGHMTQFSIDGPGTYNVIEMEKNTALNDPSFLVNDTNWDGNCLLLDGKHHYYNSWFKTYVRNFKALNYTENHKGTGIRLHSANDADEISFLVFENPKVTGMKNGIVLEAIQPQTAVAYVTANRFTNVTIEDCVNMIDIQGEIFGALPTFEASANQFTNLQLQLSPATEIAIRCSSQFNKFDGMCWDDYHVPSQFKLFQFTAQSANNDMTGLYFQNQARLDDLGENNKTYHDTVDGGSALSNVFNPIVSNQKRQMIGNQDDVLANAHNEYTVTQTSANSYWYGNINNLFTTEKDFTGWNGATAAAPVVFEVDMTAKGGISELDMLGLTFRPGLQYPRLVKIEVATASGGAYTEIYSTTNNQSGDIVVDYYAAKAWRLRVTLGDSVDETTNRRIRASRFWATCISKQGNAYVKTTGDSKVGGDVEFIANKGAVLTSPDGSRYRLKVDNAGVLTTTKL